MSSAIHIESKIDKEATDNIGQLLEGVLKAGADLRSDREVMLKALDVVEKTVSATLSRPVEINDCDFEINAAGDSAVSATDS